MPPQLCLGSTEHSRVVNDIPIHLTNAPIRIKEYNEEYKRETQRNFGTLVDTEQKNEQRSEHKAWKRIQNLNIRIKHRSPEFGSAEQESGGHAEKDAKDEPPDHLLHRYQQVVVDVLASEQKRGI